MTDELISAEMKKTELEIAKEFKRVCEDNGFTYFICYGSLLGAVRHKGFIPWDDDMDFLMPRPDYERFLKEAPTLLNSRYRLRTMAEGDYIYFFAKIDDTQTTLVETYNEHSNYKGGVYIDIFPLDGLPKGKGAVKNFTRRMKYERIFSTLSVADFSNKKRNLAKRAVIRFAKCFNGKKLQQKLDKKVRKYSYGDSELCWNAFDDFVMPTELFKETADYVFEDTTFKSVKDSDALLKIFYGDYMRLPDEKDRNSGHVISHVDINKPYDEN